MKIRCNPLLHSVAAGLLLFFGQLGGTLAATTSESANDVRVLIDISGSMKHNDPLTLRAPALRLLTGLLPQGARAGVWTYGLHVNMLVPHGVVDSRWKDRAQQAAAEINSNGLFTNIEEALLKASHDWRSPDPASQRSLIMLTDGLVDVSKDHAMNAASRDRIINDILPRLRAAQVKIHTIALSKEADHALLRQLAAATEGWYEQVNNADSLQRVFLRMFEKATKPDTLPLKDNTVQVDASIEEMTFLVFRESGKQVELISPGGKQFGAAAVPTYARWHADTGYDLITITRPEAGLWRIRGTQDLDNRVMVVTNLKARVTTLPNNLSVDDSPFYFVQLLQEGRVIRQQDFLELVKITLRQQDAHGKTWTWPLLDTGVAPDSVAGDGTFSYRFTESMQAGRHELIVEVDGTTFKREQRQVINVYSQPAVATVTSHPEGGGRYILSVIPHAGLIDTQTMQVMATLTAPDGKRSESALTQNGPAEWREEIRIPEGGGRYRAEFNVQGMRPDGKPVSKKLNAVTFGADGIEEFVEAPAPVAAPEPDAEPVPAPVTEPEEQGLIEAPEENPAGAEVNWVTVAWQALLFNALLLPAAFFGYKRWRRGAAAPVIADLEEARPS